MQARLPYLLLLSFTGLWCAGFIAAPLLGEYSIAYYLRQVYAPVCHQIEAHSFHLHGLPLAICMRCSALYVGFFFGTLLVPFLRIKNLRFLDSRYFIPVLIVPMLVDVTASWIFAGYTSTELTRFLSGGFFGIGSALVLAPLFVTAVRQTTDPQSPYSLFYNKGETL